jgi:hypothetical protein
MALDTPFGELVARAERIGVIGSPSSTGQLTLDILGTAVNRKLVGELSLFRFSQDGRAHYSLGQITEVELRNVWMEDATMRSLVRQRGRIDPVTEQQDTHVARMTLGAVFGEGEDGFEPSILGTVPPTGTDIHVVNDEMLDGLLHRYRSQLFYLGRVYGSTPKLPLWFKHFDTGEAGAGEAYHLGIFGKTGSGKSVLAKMIMLAYARHRGMSIFVIDPQGEFAKDIRGALPPGGFPLDVGNVIADLGRSCRVVAVHELVLDRWDLFEEILYECPFFEQLTMPRGENRRLAAQAVRGELEGRVTLANLHARESFSRAWDSLAREEVQRVFYRSAQSRARFNSALEQASPDEFYNQYWQPVARLFDVSRANAVRVDALLRETLDLRQTARPVTVIDLSGEEQSGLYWNETIRLMVVRRFLQGLTYQAEGSYQENRSLNTLVIVDEAHRLAPPGRTGDEQTDLVKHTFVDAVRTTRKYGLGWLFISQTLASIDREITQQVRIFFFGFGLALGTEFEALRQLIGGDRASLTLYQSFRDPHSAFDSRTREYPFMTVGPVSPLSFAGTPLFFTAFNDPEQFLDENALSPPQEDAVP